jgi:hypothetical protein
MHVKVIVKNEELSISCGPGQQSFQWLAAVIQERLKTFRILRKSLEPETYIVTELRNAEGELINPKDKIFEHNTASGLIVHAMLANSFPVDEWENPVYNDWMEVAHLNSGQNQNWSKEMSVWRENLAEIKKNSSATENIYGLSNEAAKHIDINNALLASKALPQNTAAKLIKIGFDFTEADVELAFNLDWQIMSWKWMNSSMNDLQKNKLGDILKLNYSLICNIFSHYAGVAKGMLYLLLTVHREFSEDFSLFSSPVFSRTTIWYDS